MKQSRKFIVRLSPKQAGRRRSETTKMRADLLHALNQAVLSASPAGILDQRLRMDGERLIVNSLNVNLASYKRILVIGGGKAAASMASEIEKLLGGRITAGLVNVPDYLKSRPKLRRIELHDATHPTPSLLGVRGVEKMLNLVGKPSKKDLIICLISGGGSALMPMPISGLRLSDEKRVTDLLLRSGAPIHEINTVRKHISAIKGGRLAEKLYPARVLTLIISDVVGDRLDAIASGPTVPDVTTYTDTRRILLKLGLWRMIPRSVKSVIDEGMTDNSLDTPKPGSKVFRHVSNVLLGTNKQSCLAAAAYLTNAGYNTLILSTNVHGEAKEIGCVYAGILTDIRNNGFPIRPPAAVVTGGESTVTIVENGGRGGRNQELVLSTLNGIDGLRGAVIASMGTDGVDGPTDAAGAIGDGESLARGRKFRLDADSFLSSHNTYFFFKKLGDLIHTGPTGTNVNDITIFAVK